MANMIEWDGAHGTQAHRTTAHPFGVAVIFT